MDNVITRSLLRSFHNKIKDKLGVATDQDINDIIDGIDFIDVPPVPTPSKKTADSSLIEESPGGSANWLSYIYSMESGDGVNYLYVPAGTEDDVAVSSYADSVKAITNGGTLELFSPENEGCTAEYFLGEDSIFEGYGTIKFTISESYKSSSDLAPYVGATQILLQNLTYR